MRPSFFKCSVTVAVVEGQPYVPSYIVPNPRHITEGLSILTFSSQKLSHTVSVCQRGAVCWAWRLFDGKSVSPPSLRLTRLPNLLSPASASLLCACMYGWGMGYRPRGSRVKTWCWVGILSTFRLHLMHLPTQSQPIPRPHALPTEASDSSIPWCVVFGSRWGKIIVNQKHTDQRFGLNTGSVIIALFYPCNTFSFILNGASECCKIKPRPCLVCYVIIKLRDSNFCLAIFQIKKRPITSPPC